LSGQKGVIVAASDYMKVLPDAIARWSPTPIYSLGTDGYGRSGSRASLRDFFEVDARFITVGVLTRLFQEGEVSESVVSGAIRDLDIDPDKLNPHLD
jgi:pyruvate dehydrogenase E1 component